MPFAENISLKEYNTFHIDAKARYFAAFSSVEELSQLLNERKTNNNSAHPVFILGGGSNILFTRDFDGYLLRNEITGISELHEDTDHVYVRAGAGVNWHQFVLYCLGRNWAGVENLSLIPGTVGAAPIQNIGAYGVELNDVFWSLEAYHLQQRQQVTFTAGDCAFGYRNSSFKSKYKDQFAILSVTFKLKKKPIFHTGYGTLEQELETMGVKELSIKAISDAVIRIRSSKLPDPVVIGNAGSFFKNPEVGSSTFADLKKKFPTMVAYPLPTGKVKLAAGWLVENCGPNENTSWKGYRRGDAGVHDKQALVLVNYGNSSGKEIYELSEEILKTVNHKFGVKLEREVNIV